MRIRWGKMSEQAKLFTQQVDLLLDLLNQQRHDWLNHFQVLLGYLRLGKTQEGEAYLRQVTEAIQSDSRIARMNCPLLAVFFLTFNFLHHDFQLQVEAEEHLDLSRLHIEHERFSRLVIDLVLTVQQHVVDDQQEQPRLRVSLAERHGYVAIGFYLAARLTESGNSAVKTLLEAVCQHGGMIARWTHEADEWVLEMKFSCCT